METAAPVHRDGNRAGNRGALACAGDAEKSALLRFHDAQRERILSRVLLVLLHKRAGAAVPQPALSAGLQHGAALVFLVVSPSVVLSVEHVLSGGLQAELSNAGPGVACQAAGAVLVRLHSGLLHLFDDA